MKAEFQFTAEDFDTLRGIIREEIRQELTALKPKYYTRKEAADLLKITLTTLHRWTTSGLIQKSKIEGKVLYPETEINRVLSGHTKW